MRTALRASLAILALAALGGCAERAPVAAGACPPWPDYPADLHSNDGSPWLGCTNAANLEAMVAHKKDLTAGRRLGPADGAREAKAIEDYEAGKTKTPTTPGTTGSAVLLQPSPQGTQATQ